MFDCVYKEGITVCFIDDSATITIDWHNDNVLHYDDTTIKPGLVQWKIDGVCSVKSKQDKQRSVRRAMQAQAREWERLRRWMRDHDSNGWFRRT